jgi:hypothetical protein
MKLRYGNLIVSGLTVILISMACTPQVTPPPADMVNTLAVQMASIMLTQTAASLPFPLPATATSTASSTDTPTPTVELQPSETQSPGITPTFSIPLVIASPTRRPPRTKSPTDTPTVMVERLPADTPSPTPTATLSCEGDTDSILLSVSTESLKVGDTVKVTVTVNNEGCFALGGPEYSLYIQSEGSQSIFTPEQPDPVGHHPTIQPGQSDSAEFELVAISSGQVTLTGSISYEVHLGFPGPAFWGYGETAPLLIAVVP